MNTATRCWRLHINSMPIELRRLRRPWHAPQSLRIDSSELVAQPAINSRPAPSGELCLSHFSPASPSALAWRRSSEDLRPRTIQILRCPPRTRSKSTSPLPRSSAQCSITSGKPVANAKVFFIAKHHQTNLVQGIAGSRSYQLPDAETAQHDETRREAVTDAQGKFLLPTNYREGTLAVSTPLVDLQPFALPEVGQPMVLRLAAPAYLVVDWTYHYVDDPMKKSTAAATTESEDPNQCWMQINRLPDDDPLWRDFQYRRTLQGGGNDSLSSQKPEALDGNRRNKYLATNFVVALPPGKYQVYRYRAGRMIDNRTDIVLTAGANTKLDWTRMEGAAVFGSVSLPTIARFVRQPVETPRKLEMVVGDQRVRDDLVNR